MGNVARIQFDQAACKKCKLCIKACFEDVLRWDEGADEPVAAYLEDCVACLACEGICPAECIEVVPRFPVELPAPY